MAVNQLARMDIHTARDARFECHFGRGCAELEQNLSHRDRARFGKPARARESLRIARTLAFAHACIAYRNRPELRLKDKRLREGQKLGTQIGIDFGRLTLERKR